MLTGRENPRFWIISQNWKSQKTPKREIEQAKRELADFKEREGKA